MSMGSVEGATARYVSIPYTFRSQYMPMHLDVSECS